jgi:hypothetical protein
MGGYTIRELAREADREVSQRRWVYPRLVDQGKLTRPVADRQLAIMEEIADRLRHEAEAEEAASRLL